MFFRSGHFHNVVSTFTNVVKLDVENDNVVSTLSNVVHVNVEIRNVDSTLFDIVHFNVEIHNVDLTLSHIAKSHQPKDNVETTLKCLLGYFSYKKIFKVNQLYNSHNDAVHVAKKMRKERC